MSMEMLLYYRNLAKKAKKTRHEREKTYMETMRGLGCVVGDYVGDGQGESENVMGESQNMVEEPAAVDVEVEGADAVVDQSLDEEDSSDDAHPLLFFFDCETTGFGIYDDHLTDIAAKVVNSPVPVSSPTFSTLVRTSRRIPAAGIVLTHRICINCYNHNVLSL